MTERNEAWIIIGDHIHGASTHTPDEAKESILLLDLRRPTIQVTTERDSRTMWKEVASHLFAFHKLDQDADALIIISQFLEMAIEQRVRIHDAGVDSGDGVCQCRKFFFLRALVREKDAFVFTGKGSAEVILQQTGRADNERSIACFNNDLFEVLNNFRRELTLQEFSIQQRKIFPHLLFRFVFLVVPVNKAVEGHKVVENIRAEVIRIWDPETITHFRRSGLFDDAHGEQHARGFPTDLSAADLTPADFLQILRRKPLTRHLDIFQLVAHQRADEHHDDLLQTRLIFSALLKRHGLDDLGLFKK